MRPFLFLPVKLWSPSILITSALSNSEKFESSSSSSCRATTIVMGTFEASCLYILIGLVFLRPTINPRLSIIWVPSLRFIVTEPSLFITLSVLILVLRAETFTGGASSIALAIGRLLVRPIIIQPCEWPITVIFASGSRFTIACSW